MDIELKNIIAGCKKSKSKAQEKLYRRYAKLVMGVCLRYMKNEPEALDMMQDSFVKIFDKVKQYEPSGSFDGWIRRLTANTCLDQLRKNAKTRYNLDITEIEAPYTETNVLDDLSAKDILRLLHEMPEGYRTVFNLYAVEGYTHKEIGEKLGISENTSKSQYSRAKSLLKKLIIEQNAIIAHG